MKAGARLPRRLVYVVDRRAVVDQTTTVADDIKSSSEDEGLRVSTLRGQHVDKREWLEDPTAPAIIVGTVDMIGSRLMFSGYGVSRKMRPFHAGLLGADALVVLDESHLVPPFERLLEAIETDNAAFGPQDETNSRIVPPFKLLSLSATALGRKGTPFQLEQGKGDLDDKVVKSRLEAKKRLTIEPINGKNLEEGLAGRAWALSGEATKPVRILIYCNRRDVAEKTKKAIDGKAEGSKKNGVPAADIETELFVGARRVKERADAAEKLKALGFLGGIDVNLDKPAFLIATSAGEVGVDLDADHMVCDLVAWERMVQRLGRVNRRGGRDRLAEVHIVLDEPKKPNVDKPTPPPGESAQEPEKPGRLSKGADEEARTEHEAKKKQYEADKKSYKEKKKQFGKAHKEYPERLRKYDEAWQEYRLFETRYKAVECLTGDGSPSAIRALKIRAEADSKLRSTIEAATTAPPLYPALTRALVDAWAMTSLEKHTGRPEVAPWLRGWVKDDPQTTVVWRKYLPVRRTGGEASKKEVEDFFEAAPPHLSEKLETETWRVVDWLIARANAMSKAGQMESDLIVALALEPDGNLREHFRFRALLKSNDKEHQEQLQKALAGTTLIIDARLAGLKDGLLSHGVGGEEVRTADDGGEWPADVRFHIRAASDDDALNSSVPIAYTFATKRTSEGEDIERLLIKTKTTQDSRAVSIRPQLLEEHQSWAEECAREIAKSIGLTGDHVGVLAIAARLHDEGKKAPLWQRAFNAPKNGIYAKTKGPLFQSCLGGYRHEFGSLSHVERDDVYKQLPPDLQELVLHLIAAHHGRARPVIETKACDDAPSLLMTRARDVTLRFARLQKNWGPWGLAWWEALLRAADQQASRNNDKKGNPNGGS